MPAKKAQTAPSSKTGKSSNVAENQVQQNVDRITEIIENELFTRRKLMEMFQDRRRNIEEECGYPDTATLTPEVYYNLYERDPIGARIVDIYPEECWQVAPMVYEDEDVEVTTPFEKAFEEVCRGLGDIGVYQGEEGNPFWEYLERVDRLSRIGRYGCLLLGVDDGKDLIEPLDLIDLRAQLKKKPKPFESQPKEEETSSASSAASNAVEQEYFKPVPAEIEVSTSDPQASKTPTRKLLYLRALYEGDALISAWESDPKSSRFGKPLYYSITISGGILAGGPAGIVDSTVTKRVHWSRIVHIADGLESNEVLGTPAQQKTYNRQYDLHKLYGGSAEMFWQGALPGLSFETHPQLGGQVDIDTEGMRRQIEQYMTRLQRYLAAPGMSVKSLAPQVADPTKHIDAQLEAICILIGVPKRVFLGSERGELSSSQDIRAWYSRLAKRQNGYLTPRVIVPVITRLIQCGVLPVPEKWSCVWPDVASITDLEKADIAVKRTEAMSKYVQGGVDGLIDPLDYLVRVIGFDEQEAKEVIASKMQSLESEEGLDIHAREDQIREEDAQREQEAMDKLAAQNPKDLEDEELEEEDDDLSAKKQVPPQLAKKVGNSDGSYYSRW